LGNASGELSKTVASASLVPVLALSLAVDRPSAIPGNTLTDTAKITNTGNTLTDTAKITNTGDTLGLGGTFIFASLRLVPSLERDIQFFALGRFYSGCRVSGGGRFGRRSCAGPNPGAQLWLLSLPDLIAEPTLRDRLDRLISLY